VALASGLLVALGGVCHASPPGDPPEVLVGLAFLALLPFIFVETVVCHSVMGEHFLKLLLVVTVANVLSAVLVVPAGERFHSMWSIWSGSDAAIFWGAFLSCATLSVIVEGIVVVGFFKGTDVRRVWKAVLFANLLTWGGMVVFIA
jgi:hypothetical protein